MSEATPCPEPLERLDPNPAVAVFALRYPSEGEAGRTHDVALTPDGFWSCECFPWLEHDDGQGRASDVPVRLEDAEAKARRVVWISDLPDVARARHERWGRLPGAEGATP